MSLKSSKFVLMAVGLALFGALVVMAGCRKSAEATSPAAPGNTGGSTPVASAGRQVYDANGCTRCHSIGGQGGRMGPDLSKVGADPTHTAQWIIAHVKNPRTHNPMSRMPAFEGKINDQDLQALGDYLAGLKG